MPMRRRRRSRRSSGREDHDDDDDSGSDGPGDGESTAGSDYDPGAESEDLEEDDAPPEFDPSQTLPHMAMVGNITFAQHLLNNRRTDIDGYSAYYSSSKVHDAVDLIGGHRVAVNPTAPARATQRGLFPTDYAALVGVQTGTQGLGVAIERNAKKVRVSSAGKNGNVDEGLDMMHRSLTAEDGPQGEVVPELERCTPGAVSAFKSAPPLEPRAAAAAAAQTARHAPSL